MFGYCLLSSAQRWWFIRFYHGSTEYVGIRKPIWIVAPLMLSADKILTNLKVILIASRIVYAEWRLLAMTLATILCPLAGLRALHPLPEEAKQTSVPGPDHTVSKNGDSIPDWDAWGLVVIIHSGERKVPLCYAFECVFYFGKTHKLWCLFLHIFLFSDCLLLINSAPLGQILQWL